MALLGLCCCSGFSLVVVSGAPLQVHQILIVVASPVVEHNLSQVWASVVVAMGSVVVVPGL